MFIPPSSRPSILGRICAPSWPCCSALIYIHGVPFSYKITHIIRRSIPPNALIGRLGLVGFRCFVLLRFLISVVRLVWICFVCRRFVLRQLVGLVWGVSLFPNWMGVVHAWRIPVFKRTPIEIPHTRGTKTRFRGGGGAVKMDPEFWGKWANFGPFTPNILNVRQNPVVGATTRKKGPFCFKSRRFFMGVTRFSRPQLVNGFWKCLNPVTR